MSTTSNPGVNQSQRAVTEPEVQHFLKDALTQASAQFHPGKLKINRHNSDALHLYLRDNDQTRLTAAKALLDAHNYIQAVKTLVAGYVNAIKALRFEAGKLQWDVHRSLGQ